jgi:hypothetical protein
VVHHALSAIGVLAGRGAIVVVDVEAVPVTATFFRRVTWARRFSAAPDGTTGAVPSTTDDRRRGRETTWNPLHVDGRMTESRRVREVVVAKVVVEVAVAEVIVDMA